MCLTENPYHIDEERSDVQFDVYGNQVAFMIPAGTGDTTIYDMLLIGDRDNTTPTNQNTFSALRILDEINSAIGNGNKFIRKDMEDSTDYLLTMNGGARIDGTRGLWIGDALLTYENGALRLSNAAGFWTEGYVSALDEGSGGGGGSGGDTFTRQALFSVLESTPGTGEYINPSFIPIDGTSIYIQNGVLKSRGTISSIGMTVPTGLTVSGVPLTSDGTIALGLASGYVIPTESRLSTMESSISDLEDAVEILESMFGIDSDDNVYVKNGRGFYGTSFISALGQGSDSGGGGGANLAEVWQSLSTATDDYAAVKIDSAHIKLGTGLSLDASGNIVTTGGAGWNNSNHPTNVEGYGITDVYTKTQADSLFIKVAFFDRLFKAYNGTTAVAANDTTSTIDNIKAMFGFWTEQYVSSLGQGSDSGSSAGINEQELWNILSDDAGTEVIDVSHIPELTAYAPASHTHTFASLTEKPTTLSEYGITDAYTKTESDSRYVMATFFDSLFELYNSSTKISVNGELPADTSQLNIKAMFGFWTSSYISALGQGATSEGMTLAGLADVNVTGAQDGDALVYDFDSGTWVPGEAGGLDTDAMWAALATDDSTKQIHLSHLTTALSGYVTTTSLTNTLDDYVTLADSQTISGQKTFTSAIYTSDIYSNYFSFRSGGYYLGIDGTTLKWYDSYGNGTNVLYEHPTNGANTTITNADGYVLSAITVNNLGHVTSVARKQLDADDIPTLPASKIGSGTFGTARIPDMDASKITSGTFQTGRIPNLDASKITSGTFQTGRIPDMDASKITSGTFQVARIPDLSGYYLPLSGGTMTGDIEMSGSTRLYFSGGASGRRAWINHNGALCFQATTSSGWASGNMYLQNDGTTLIGYASGAFGSVNTLNYYFYGGTYDSPLAVIKPNGNVGIGTTSPSYNLHVNGTAGFNSYAECIKTDTTNARFTSTNSVGSISLLAASQSRGIFDQTLAQWVIAVNGSNTFANVGNFGIGTTSPGYKLHVSGTIYATGDVTALSDMRRKQFLTNVSASIEDAAKLPLFHFTWKDKQDELVHIGTSAQAVREVFPELVLGKDELSLNYATLGTALGILSARKLTEHEKEIKALKDEITLLRERIKALEGAA